MNLRLKYTLWFIVTLALIYGSTQLDKILPSTGFLAFLGVALIFGFGLLAIHFIGKIINPKLNLLTELAGLLFYYY